VARKLLEVLGPLQLLSLVMAPLRVRTAGAPVALPALGPARGLSGWTQRVTQRSGGSGPGGTLALLPYCWLCAPYALPMHSEVDPINLGAHRGYSRSTQGVGRRYAGATSLPTRRECIYETEHLAVRDSPSFSPAARASRPRSTANWLQANPVCGISVRPQPGPGSSELFNALTATHLPGNLLSPQLIGI